MPVLLSLVKGSSSVLELEYLRTRMALPSDPALEPTRTPLRSFSPVRLYRSDNGHHVGRFWISCEVMYDWTTVREQYKNSLNIRHHFISGKLPLIGIPPSRVAMCFFVFCLITIVHPQQGDLRPCFAYHIRDSPRKGGCERLRPLTLIPSGKDSNQRREYLGI